MEGVDVIGPRNHDFDNICVGYLAGRQSGRPFDGEVVRGTELGGEIGINLAGLLAVRSLSGKYYVMAITNGHSQYLDKGFPAEKPSSETVATLEAFIVWFERETEKKVKHVRTDEGWESLGEFGKVFRRGVLCETTALYSPSQNGISERVDHTLLDHAHAMMYNDSVPSSLWTEVVAIAVQLHTTIRRRRHRGSTPFEI